MKIKKLAYILLLVAAQACAMEKDQDIVLPTDHYAQELSRWLEDPPCLPVQDQIQVVNLVKQCDISLSLCWHISYGWSREKGSSLELHEMVDDLEHEIAIDL